MRAFHYQEDIPPAAFKMTIVNALSLREIILPQRGENPVVAQKDLPHDLVRTLVKTSRLGRPFKVGHNLMEFRILFTR